MLGVQCALFETFSASFDRISPFFLLGPYYVLFGLKSDSVGRFNATARRIGGQVRSTTLSSENGQCGTRSTKSPGNFQFHTGASWQWTIWKDQRPGQLTHKRKRMCVGSATDATGPEQGRWPSIWRESSSETESDGLLNSTAEPRRSSSAVPVRGALHPGERSPRHELPFSGSSFLIAIAFNISIYIVNIIYFNFENLGCKQYGLRMNLVKESFRTIVNLFPG